MKLGLEVQLMRTVGDLWLPRSRPSRGYLHLGDNEASYTKLYPGAAAEGMEEMVAVVEGATRILPTCASLRASLRIENIPFGDARPGIVFLGVTDYYTCIIHFPIVAGNDNKMFRGFHSLQMRLVDGL